MNKMLLTALMSFATIGGLSAATPCETNDVCAPSCYNPCGSTYASSYCSFLDGVSIDADFLWWQTSADNVLTTVVSRDDSVSPAIAVRNDYRLDYKWQPGYRIELGYDSCVCGYDVNFFAKWTWFRTSAKTNLEFTLASDQFLSINDPFISQSYDDDVNASVVYGNSSSFLYERLDFGFMSGCYQLGYFNFKPVASVTGVFVKDTYNTALASDTPEISQLFRNTGKYTGAGITIGAEVSYPVMQCVSLYSVSELTGLWGKVRINTNSTVSDATATPETVITTFSDHFWAGRVILAQEFGVEYNACVYSFPVNMHLGWEFLYLPDMVMISNNVVEDRTVNGLVAGIAIGF